MSVAGTATVELLSSNAGGLKTPVPSGTRSLLISFRDSEEEETFGAVIEALDGRDLTPGSTILVRLAFWSDTARIYGSRGATFGILYGREVGWGEIIDPVSDD